MNTIFFKMSQQLKCYNLRRSTRNAKPINYCDILKDDDDEEDDNYLENINYGFKYLKDGFNELDG